MPQLIKDRRARRRPLDAAARGGVARRRPAGSAGHRAARAVARRSASALLARGDVGVWLAPDDDPAALAADVGRAAASIAVDFPKFTDGRGYSIGAAAARALRLHAASCARSATCCATSSSRSRECGFDAFADPRRPRCDGGARRPRRFHERLRADRRATPQPWFRRRARRIGRRTASAARVEAAVALLAGRRGPPFARRVRIELRRRGHGA